jgi:ABC-type dipeptide/oligopeptide/nickel transport system ATPase component
VRPEPVLANHHDYGVVKTQTILLNQRRAVWSGPPTQLLLMDEPTSALDGPTERKIMVISSSSAVFNSPCLFSHLQRIQLMCNRSVRETPEKRTAFAKICRPGPQRLLNTIP